jgi:hypothetical protein
LSAGGFFCKSGSFFGCLGGFTLQVFLLPLDFCGLSARGVYLDKLCFIFVEQIVLFN